MRSTAARGRLELRPGVWLDARRAVYLEKEATLAIADPHLGYAWAQRAAGNLVPLGAGDEWAAALTGLIDEYAPRRVVVLGDFVHRAVRVEAIETEVCRFIEVVETRAELVLVGGNHDRGLDRLLERCGKAVEVRECLRCEDHLLIHGHEAADGKMRVLMGHEHPVLTLGDPAGGSVRCPCFLVGERVTVLPAMSRWAAGCNVRSGRFLSEMAGRKISIGQSQFSAASCSR